MDHSSEESGTKGITIVVEHDGKQCLTLRANTQLAKHMVGYALIHKDLKSCLSCINTYRLLTDSENDQFLKWAVYIAFHTTYGKCFASAEGRRIKLESSQVVPSNMKAVHNKIIDLRNKYTAHAGGYEEIGVATIGLNPDVSRKEVLTAGPPICLYISHISEHDLRLYESLIHAIIPKVETFVEEKRKALESEFKKMNIEMLYEAASKS